MMFLMDPEYVKSISKPICHSRIQLQDGGQGSSWWGSWWPISKKFDMVHLHNIPDGSQACPKHFQTHMSLKNPTPGWRTGSILTGFLMTNLHEIWNLGTLLCLELAKMSISNNLWLSLRSPPPQYVELDGEWTERPIVCKEKDCADITIFNIYRKSQNWQFCFRDVSEKLLFTSQLIYKSSLLSFIEQLWHII